MKEKNKTQDVARKLDEEYERHKKELEKIGVASYMEGCVFHFTTDKARLCKTIKGSRRDSVYLLMEFIKAIRNSIMKTNGCSKEEASIEMLEVISTGFLEEEED